jgi:glycosyl transferase family 1
VPVTRLYQRLRGAGQAGATVLSSQLHRSQVPKAAATWPLAPDLSQRLSVRWPTSYEWGPAAKWVDGLRAEIAAQVPVSAVEIDQGYEGAVLIDVGLDGRRHRVAIDYFDSDRLLDEVVASCALIFKMQYRLGGYDNPRVVPGGYVPGRPHLARYLPALRRLRSRSAPMYQVYGRFGISYATEYRRTAVQALSAQTRFEYEGSLKLLPYAAYLREAAQSRVCIDLPGNGDMCHRLIEYLAIGCCVVRPAPLTRLPVELTDGVNIRYVQRDLSDLVDVCAELIGDPARTTDIGLAARDYYDRYLQGAQLGGYYLDRCVAILGSG